MNQIKLALINNLQQKLGIEDPDLAQLVEFMQEDDEKFRTYQESVCDIVNAYHNEKKDLAILIEDFITVLSATREYELNRSMYSEKQEKLLWDTGSEVLIKALKLTK